MEFQGPVDNQEMRLWELDPATNRPKNDDACLAVLQHMLDNPGWEHGPDSYHFGRLLLDTVTSKSEAGVRASKIQKALLEKTPELFDVVTVEFAGEEPIKIPKVRLLALSEFFRVSAITQMREGRSLHWKFDRPFGMPRHNLKPFLDYLQTGTTTISEENVNALLDLAMYFNIEELGNKCAAYIAERLKTSGNLLPIFLQAVASRPENTGFIAQAKYALLEYVSRRDLDKKVLDSVPQEKRAECEYFFDLARQAAELNCTLRIDDNERRRFYFGFESRESRELDYLEKLQRISSVQRLDVAAYRLVDKDLQRISDICGDTLEVLDCEWNMISDCKGCNFPELVELNISYCKFTNEGLQRLTRIAPKLVCLKMSSTEVTSIKGCQKFEKLLVLRACFTKLTDEAVCNISTLAPNLQELDLFQSRISSLHKFSGALASLKSLNLSCAQIDDASLQALSAACGKSLEVLEVSYTSITSFANCNFPKLRKLVADGARLTNDGLYELSKSAVNTLEELSVNGCKQLVGEYLKYFPKLIHKEKPPLVAYYDSDDDCFDD